MVFLVELFANDSLGTEIPLYFSSAAGMMTRPTEVPANTVFESRVLSAGNYERHAWGKGTTRGKSTVAFGAVTLNNGDGALDSWLQLGFEGKGIIIREGPEGAAYPSGFTTVFSGIISRVEVNWQTVYIYLLDMTGALADKVLQVTKYLGTNALPSGIEGVAGDIKGRPKPKLRGTVQNLQPILVNTSQLIYQIDDGTALLPMTLKVYSAGVEATAGVSRASLAALIAGTPSAGTYDYYAGSDGWFIKLGFTPAGGPITCDCSEGTIADRTIGQIVKRLVSQEGGFSASLIDGVAELDAACPYEIGFWESGETTVGSVIDSLLGSGNASLTDTRTGRFKLARVRDPSTATSVATFETWQLKTGGQGLSLQYSADAGIGVRIGANGLGNHAYEGKYVTRQGSVSGLPVWRVLVDYSRNFTVMKLTEGAVSVTQARFNFLQEDYRTTIVSDPTVLTQHPRAPEFVVQTLIVNESQAIVEGNFQLALRSIPRYIIYVPLDPSDGKLVDVMDTFTLRVNRFGWDTGKNFLCIGLIEFFGDAKSAAMTTLVGWG